MAEVFPDTSWTSVAYGMLSSKLNSRQTIAQHHLILSVCVMDHNSLGIVSRETIMFAMIAATSLGR